MLGGTGEVAEEEVIVVSLIEPRARVVHETRRTAGDVGDGRNDPRRLIVVPLVLPALFARARSA